MVRQREFEWPGPTWRRNVTAAVKYLEPHTLHVEVTRVSMIADMEPVSTVGPAADDYVAFFPKRHFTRRCPR